jgi:membrane protein implicated in regulation of membrane protease activity
MAFFVSMLTDNLLLQLIIFFVVSFLLLFLTRPIAVRYFNKQRVKTNYESIIGLEGKVTKRIDNFNNSGEVILNGQEWTARAADETTIYEVNEKVVVKEIAGVKLIVGKKEEEV